MNSQQKKILTRYFNNNYKDFSHIEYILEQVYLYKYNESWCDSGIEGKFFVYKSLNESNPFIVILNKKDVNDFFIKIEQNQKIDYKDNLLIIGQEKKHIGIWFINKEEGIDVYKLLKEWKYE